MATTDDTYRPSRDAAFDDHGLDRALAEAITQTSFDPASVALDAESSETSGPGNLRQWRAHPAGECGRNAAMGVDFSQSHLTLIEVSDSANGRVVSGLLVRELDESNQAETIAEAFRSYGAPPGTNVHVSITSPRAVVRRFTMPKVPRKRREAAACWQARKLIPFPISDTDSLHGFHYEAKTDSGWLVTLAAVPREDVGQGLESVQKAGWKLESVSIAGTKARADCPATQKNDGQSVTATLLWTPQRSSFVVFKDCELLFHYDLGIVPPPDLIPGQPLTEDTISRWLGTLRKATGEAIEFYGGSNPQDGIGLIQLVGVPDAAAPLITDWQERFGSPVVVTPALESAPEAWPEDARTWFERNAAMLVPAYLAVNGQSTIDLTPTIVRQRRQSHRLERITRIVFAISVLGIVAWSALTWMQKSFAARAQADLLADIHSLETSPINNEIQSCIAGIQHISSLNAALADAGDEWMPDVRRLIATLPSHARLLTLTVAPNPVIHAGAPLIRMEGVLHPTGRAHSLTYADWLRDLKLVFGEYAVTLESSRSIEWKSRVKSAFVISIQPGRTTPAPQGGR